MVRSKILVVFALLTIPVFLAAGDRGYRLSEPVFEDGYYVYAVENTMGIETKVSSPARIGAREQAIMEELYNEFSAWNNLRAQSVRLRFENERAYLVIVPSKLICEGKDMAGYLPSGMQFSYISGYLEYNFRMLVDNLFLRFFGRFVDREQFCAEMAEAVANPFAYIQANDPAYAMRKLVSVEKELDKLQTEAAENSGSVEELRSSLKELSARHRRLREEHEKLLSDYRDLLYSVMVLHNTGWFRGPTPFDREGLKRVVELKERNPSWNAEEIAPIIKDEGFELSNQEIKLILKVYFQEF
ncbi:MAG: hypothetical protein K9L68_02035 [Spirochaetales bacterium]|nr:hypothetical protein [Spirochaetales bacterium]MCF7937358.1 hypothetical protein [Spirochaetales bacterium]